MIKLFVVCAVCALFGAWVAETVNPLVGLLAALLLIFLVELKAEDIRN